MNKDQVVIVMARPPEKGKVKTRLAATIGEDKTLRIYEALLDKVMLNLTALDAKSEIFWTNQPYPAEFSFFSNKSQSAGDLGAKMQNAFTDVFKAAHGAVVMIGTDCYDLDAPRLMAAFNVLQKVDVVIGPALDGGYYLIGMNRLYTTLFQLMPWSTAQLLTTTITRMREKQLSFILLPALRDIDEASDVMATDELRAYLI